MRLLVVSLLVLALLAGCFQKDPAPAPPAPTPTGPDGLTAVAGNAGSNSTLTAVPPEFRAGFRVDEVHTGFQGAEPNVGVTSSGTVFATAFAPPSPLGLVGGIVRSTDGGRTFTPPKKLNDDVDPGALRLQVTPNLDVSPDGRVTAAWWDFRDDTGAFTNDVYATWSDDNGATWSRNEKITDQPINRRLGVWSNGSDMRGPPAIASAKEYTVFGWDDTRFGATETPVQDVFIRSVQFEALGGGSNDTARALAAAMAGLALAGLLLLAVALAARRRQPGAPAVVERQPTSVG